VQTGAKVTRVRAARGRLGPSVEGRFALGLNLPVMVILAYLVGYPIISSLMVSLYRYNLRSPDAYAFIGLGNYVQVLHQSEFWHSLIVTMKFTGLAVAAAGVLGMGLALLLNQEFPGRPVLRALLLVPWAIPPVVNGMMWRWIFDSKIGALNGLLYSLGIIDTYKNWLLEPKVVIWTVVAAHVWNHVPLVVIILLSALQSIPAELYDSALVDRAGTWNRFRYITLPWLLHPLLVVVILQTMTALRAFDTIYALTGGGPGDATTVLAWLTYKTAFTYLDFGLGNAYAYIVTLITFGLALVYFKSMYAKGDIQV
jgi:multiple sugar transport system permease protein